MWIAIISAAFGFIGGMGLGGGIVLIPALTMLFGYDQHTAQAATLLAFLPMSAAAIIVHLKAKRIKYKQAGLAALTGSGGAYIGALIASQTGDGLLRLIFGIFLLFLGGLRIYFFFKKRAKEK
ncbi:MAG: sulfite exporter TauE/SafE family protein [Eubacteriales bacterium]